MCSQVGTDLKSNALFVGLVTDVTAENTIESEHAPTQCVRFIVSEVLVGPEVREVYTDASSCGYRFKPGSLYLVNAHVEGSRYLTGACSRTSRIDSDEAVEDLRALRAWRSGIPLLPRIYGRIEPADVRTDTRVHLIEDRDERSVRLDGDGRFSIDGLAKTKYRLRVEDARGKAEHEIDLSRIDCFEATAGFSDGWDIAGDPVPSDHPAP